MKRAVRRTIRLSEEESERYEQAAHAEGVEFSEWVRRACEGKMTGQDEGAAAYGRELAGYFSASDLLSRIDGTGHAPGCPCRVCNPTPTVAKVARIDREKRS